MPMPIAIVVLALLGALTDGGADVSRPVEHHVAHASSAAPGGWTWPVEGPVLRPFDPPDNPYGSGHRGIDIGAARSTAVVAPAAGQVTFAGPVGGKLFMTIDHGGGVSSTYSWLGSLLVRKGDVVPAGLAVALTGWGHEGSLVPHLHFGVKLDGTYVDPMLYLGPLSVTAFIRLAPLG
jgi:murein DD-endopeptidase MepM/ murein hydrolase activator NlpD